MLTNLNEDDLIYDLSDCLEDADFEKSLNLSGRKDDKKLENLFSEYEKILKLVDTTKDIVCLKLNETMENKSNRRKYARDLSRKSKRYYKWALKDEIPNRLQNELREKDFENIKVLIVKEKEVVKSKSEIFWDKVMNQLGDKKLIVQEKDFTDLTEVEELNYLGCQQQLPPKTPNKAQGNRGRSSVFGTKDSASSSLPPLPPQPPLLFPVSSIPPPPPFLAPPPPPSLPPMSG